jgi:hypothetical protein
MRDPLPGTSCPGSHAPLPVFFAGGVGVALLLAGLASPAFAGEVSLTSDTLLHAFSRETATAGDLRYLPLFESIEGSWEGVGGKENLSLHLSGWGRLDLGEPTGEGRSEGELASAYVDYRHPAADGWVRAGRFFFVEGTTAGTLDGVFARVVTRPGVGLALYGGRPAETAGEGRKTGASLAGGRLFTRFLLAGTFIGEAGVSALREKEEGGSRQELGGDLWLRAGEAVLLSGEGVYDREASAMAWQRATLRLSPARSLDLDLGSERYDDAQLLSRSLNPALDAALDPADRVRIDSACLSWDVLAPLTLQAGMKRYRHRLADPGDATRGEVGARFRFGGKDDLVGLFAAQVKGDLAENGYREVRSFATLAAFGSLRFALEGLVRNYEAAIGGRKDALQFVGSAGYRPRAGLLLSADLRYQESPAFKRDAGVVLRAQWELKGGRP